MSHCNFDQIALISGTDPYIRTDTSHPYFKLHFIKAQQSFCCMYF